MARNEISPDTKSSFYLFSMQLKTVFYLKQICSWKFYTLLHSKLNAFGTKSIRDFSGNSLNFATVITHFYS